ncbi:MAG: GtrA family protein [Bacteroidales bacterium]|nr:GtrA family protein [Bacteroidales bacterium]
MGLKDMADRLVLRPSSVLWIQLLRYLVSGGVAFLVDTGLLALLTETLGEGHLLLWTGISFGAGLVVTYLFSIKWVFDRRNVKRRAVEFAVFAAIGVSGLLLTELFMWIFARRLGLFYLLAKVITTVIVFFWNFAAKKLLLFRN